MARAPPPALQEDVLQDRGLLVAILGPGDIEPECPQHGSPTTFDEFSVEVAGEPYALGAEYRLISCPGCVEAHGIADLDDTELEVILDREIARLWERKQFARFFVSEGGN